MSPANLSKTSPSLEEIYKPIRTYLPQVEERILEILATPNELSSEVIRYFFKSKGKFLRPALVLFGSLLGSDIPESAFLTAAALEIFHSATLIHDDIIDSAYLRRNLPTVNTKWNPQVAVLVGDYLHDKAIGAIFDTKSDQVIAAFLKTAGVVCDGEILELKEKNNFNLKEETYLTIIERKTAALLATCLESGAVLSGLDMERVLALNRFGIYFGMAFQIMDDCLDFMGKENEFGKTLGADLQAGVLTLPLIRLIQLLDEKGKAEVFSKVKSGLSHTQLGDLVLLLEEYGALNYSIEKANEFTERASLELAIFPDSPVRQSLEALLQYVIKRNR
ncbi:MAG: polyprenyl synthetase family protein [Candidatus Omnitrophica bacterium]|nr:polyprenyl synthetase family protein [Candidatus Omnitrophota bacterium]